MPNGIGSRLKTGPSQTGQLPGRIKSELCDLSGLRIDLISRLLSLSRLYSGILHARSLLARLLACLLACLGFGFPGNPGPRNNPCGVRLCVCVAPFGARVFRIPPDAP